MTDPGLTSTIDQLDATVAQLGTSLGKMHTNLRQNGVRIRTADKITADVAHELAAGMFNKTNREGPR